MTLRSFLHDVRLSLSREQSDYIPELDDPAIARALRDAEELQETIKRLQAQVETRRVAHELEQGAFNRQERMQHES